MKTRILFTSCAVLLAPLVGKVHAQLVVSPTMTYTGEGGSIGIDNFGTVGIAFAKDLIAGGAYSAHTIGHVNDGIFGNSNSWIGDSADSFVGIGFGSAQTIAAFAFGRDGTGGFGDRAVGLYTIQFTTDSNPAVNFLTNT